MRLFVAIALPDDVRNRLAELRTGIPGARWVPPENMHVTLRFIGEADGGSCRDIVDALHRVHAQSFDLVLSQVGHFGAARKERLLWAGVESNSALVDLHERVSAALRSAGLPPDTRKFTPHVTLARLKRAPTERIGEFVATHNLFRTGPIPVRQFTLFSSHLRHDGASYYPEEEFPLNINDLNYRA